MNKKNIVICCDWMDAARIDDIIYETGDTLTMYLRTNTRQGVESHIIKFCPWCGKELPFPYEEAE